MLSVLTAVPATTRAQTPIDVGTSAPRGAVMFVRLQSGSVRLSGWDRDSVHVSGRLAPGESWVTRVSADTLYLRAEGMPRGLSAPSELEMFVPRGSVLIVRAAAASLVVRDFDKSVDVATAAGNLLVESVRGDVRAETMQGTLAVIGPVPRVTASTASGALLVSVPYDTITDGKTSRVVRRAAGDRAPFGVLSVRSVSGTITVNAPQVDSALVQNVRGDSRVVAEPAPGGVVRVTSHVGLITFGWGEVAADGTAGGTARSGSVTRDVGLLDAVMLDAISARGGLRGRVPAEARGATPGGAPTDADVAPRLERSPAGVRFQTLMSGAPASADSTPANPSRPAGTIELRSVRGDIVFESLAPAPR
jgi:hypothetical protein